MSGSVRWGASAGLGCQRPIELSIQERNIWGTRVAEVTTNYGSRFAAGRGFDTAGSSLRISERTRKATDSSVDIPGERIMSLTSLSILSLSEALVGPGRGSFSQAATTRSWTGFISESMNVPLRMFLSVFERCAPPSGLTILSRAS